ncbi:hypothetical protein P3L10_011094 [Capsicum annuum]
MALKLSRYVAGITVIKLVDVLELSYTSEDKHHPCVDICVATRKEVIDDVCWMITADIVLFSPGGNLKIIER